MERLGEATHLRQGYGEAGIKGSELSCEGSSE